MRKAELLEDQALSTRVKVEAITLREIRIPLVHFFETSFGRTYSRRILLVTVHCDGGDGWAESVAGEDPYYSSEWTESAWPTIRQYLAPAVLGRSLNSARESVPLMAKVRGHRMAKAAVENALWDAEAKQKKQPLWKLLGGTRQEIQCGVSIGIQDSVEQLLDKVQLELAAGYRRIKLKVKPGWDLKIIERVRSRWPNISLSCDANSAYTLDDIDHLRKFDQFNLLMIEQPLWNDDIYYHARLQRELRTSICLDESIRHARDCAAAVETGACRIARPRRFTISARAITCRCGAEACSNPASAALTMWRFQRLKISNCPATFPLQNATGRKTSSNPKWKSRDRERLRFPTPPEQATAFAKT